MIRHSKKLARLDIVVSFIILVIFFLKYDTLRLLLMFEETPCALPVVQLLRLILGSKQSATISASVATL